MGILDSNNFNNMDFSQTQIFGDKNPFFKDGRYIVRIDETRMQTPSHAGSSTSYAIEGTVLAVDSAHAEAPAVGVKCVQIVMESNVMCTSTLLAFVLAAAGKKQAECSDEEIGALLVSAFDSNGLVGTELGLACHTIITKRNQKEFTIHNWSSAPDYAEFGLTPGAGPAPAPAPAPAVEPQYNKDASGQSIVSLDGGNTWAFVS